MVHSGNDGRIIGLGRVTRRRFLVGGTTALGAAVLGGGLAGCAGSTPGPSTPGSAQSNVGPAGATPTPAPKRGGIAYLSLAAQVGGLHPQLNGSLGMPQIYDHLYNVDYVNGKNDFSLAESMENPDPLSYIFKIRPTARHQNLPPVNGRAVDSQDVVTSWNAFVANPRTGNKGFLKDDVDHYETPSPSTLVVKMKRPNAWAPGPHGLAGPLPSVVLPRELLEQNIADKVAVGPGAYVLERFDPQSGGTFARRPDGWWTPERPYFDKVVYTVISDPAARAAAFKAKQIDFLDAGDQLAADEYKSYGADVWILKELFYASSLMMRADAPQGLFSDPRVREAVYKALDIQELIEKASLGDGEWTGPVSSHLTRWSLPVDELKKSFPHDVKAATALLSAAGWDRNREVPLQYAAGPGLLPELLQNQLGAIGIKVKLTPQDRNTVWLPAVMAGNYQLAVGLYTAFNDPDGWLRVCQTQGYTGEGNTMHWSDAEVDDFVRRQQLEFDPDKQRQIILDAQRTILKKFAPSVNLYVPYRLTAVRGYFHYLGGTRGYAGSYGNYNWIDTAHPEYPHDRK